MTLTRYFTSSHQDVAGKIWTGYDARTDTDVPDENVSPYFRDARGRLRLPRPVRGDLEPDSDWSVTRNRHDFDWGWGHQYENVQYLTLTTTTIDLPGQAPGRRVRPLPRLPQHRGPLRAGPDRVRGPDRRARPALRLLVPGQGGRATSSTTGSATGRPSTPPTREEYLGDTHALFGQRFKGHLSPRHPDQPPDHGA